MLIRYHRVYLFLCVLISYNFLVGVYYTANTFVKLAYFSKDYSRLGRLPISLPKKNLCGLLVQDLVQAGCPSNHQTNNQSTKEYLQFCMNKVLLNCVCCISHIASPSNSEFI